MEITPANTGNVVRFVAVSADLWVTGSVPAVQSRLLDLLNDQDSSTMMLQDVLLVERNGSAEQTAAYAQLPLHEILFALPVREGRTRQAAKDQFLWVQTIERRVRVDVGPYRLVGNAHLRLGGDLRDMLQMLSARFYPLTEVTITRVDDPDFRQETPVALFNGGRLILAMPVP
jgi:hypothetical protein